MRLQSLKKKHLFFVIFLLIIIFLFYNIFHKPFPFFKVDYIYNKDSFNQNPAENLDFYSIKIKKNTNFFSLNYKDIVKFKDDDIFKKIEYATELTRSMQGQSIGNKIKIYENILSDDIFFREICSESSKIFLYIMSHLGEKVRVLWLNGHTITEVWHNNNWIFVDTSSNTYAYSTKNKQYSSFLDIIESKSSIEFKTIIQNNHRLWDYRNSPKRLHEIIDENNLVFIINNRDIFNFHTSKNKINRIFNSMLFNSNFEAKQFLHNNKTPKVGNIGLNFYKRIINSN